MRPFLLTTTLLFVPACTLLTSFDPEGQACDTGEKNPQFQCLADAGYYCVGGVCKHTGTPPQPQDGGTDAGPVDSGSPDAGVDGGPGDAGTDAGQLDSGTPDAGKNDGGVISACPDAGYAGCLGKTPIDLSGSASPAIDFQALFGSPGCFKVKSTQLVKMSNVSTTHPLKQACGPKDVFNGTRTAELSVQFTTAGKYGIYCTSHGTAATGAGMGAEITVVP